MSRLRGHVPTPSSGPSRALSIRAACGLGLSLLALAGCETDSFIDPSVVGRWERTPTTVPILERIAAIEEDEGEFVEYTDPTSDDLKVDADDYRIGPGDQLDIVLYDMIVPRQPDGYQRVVDARGTIELPQLGTIPVNGLTADEAVRAIQDKMRPFLGNPLATINVTNPRQMTFHVIGAVRNPAPYFMPSSEYRVLEALTAAGGFPETTPYIYVIRQVPLSSEATVSPRAGAGNASPKSDSSVPMTGDDLLRVIDDLSGERPASEPNPGVLSTAWSQPGTTPPSSDGAPPVDLVENTPTTQPTQPASPAPGAGNWMYLDNRWVQVRTAGNTATATGGVEPRLVTQRVIRIPVKPLLSGDARYNIIIRAGDIVRVPSPDTGIVYLAGQVSRPGVYQLPDVGRLTLMRAIDAGGGLGQLAIPERVDLTRMVGPDRQATIRLNLRAINEGTQPDVFLRADDRINVGTNFWALPLAIVRGGFRMTYGFGFLLDRNFGNDVFGPPPTDRGGGF